MKKFIRKAIPLILVMSMVFFVAAMASASSVSWTGSNDYTYTMTVNRTSQYYETIKFPGSATVYHTQDQVGQTVNYSAQSTYSFTAEYDTAGTNNQYLIQAMTAAGMKTSFSKTVAAGGSKEIKATEPSGNYTVGIYVQMYVSNWELTYRRPTDPIDSVGGSTCYVVPLITSGTISYAPSGYTKIDLIYG